VLAVMIFVIYLVLPPTYSATVRNPKTDMCMDCANNKLQQVKCSAGSPSQTWTFGNRILKCKASGKCLQTNAEDGAELDSGECYSNMWRNLKIIDTHKLRNKDGNKLCLNLNGNGRISFIRCNNVEEQNYLDVYYK
jgi:hypothetical protein